MEQNGLWLLVFGQFEVLVVIGVVIAVLRLIDGQMSHAAIVSARQTTEQAVLDRSMGSKRLDQISQHVLVMIGTDQALLRDLTIFRQVRARTGLTFTRLMPGTLASLNTYLTRSRLQYGAPVRYIHLAVHAGPSGVQLDRLVTPVELSALLDGVEVLMIDGCESSEIGDDLGVVPYVVTLLEPIPHGDAKSFGLAFWSEIGRSQDPLLAYQWACKAMPHVSEYAQLHIS